MRLYFSLLLVLTFLISPVYGITLNRFDEGGYATCCKVILQTTVNLTYKGATSSHSATVIDLEEGKTIKAGTETFFIQINKMDSYDDKAGIWLEFETDDGDILYLQFWCGEPDEMAAVKYVFATIGDIAFNLAFSTFIAGPEGFMDCLYESVESIPFKIYAATEDCDEVEQGYDIGTYVKGYMTKSIKQSNSIYWDPEEAGVEGNVFASLAMKYLMSSIEASIESLWAVSLKELDKSGGYIYLDFHSSSNGSSKDNYNTLLDTTKENRISFPKSQPQYQAYCRTLKSPYISQDGWGYGLNENDAVAHIIVAKSGVCGNLLITKARKTSSYYNNDGAYVVGLVDGELGSVSKGGYSEYLKLPHTIKDINWIDSGKKKGKHSLEVSYNLWCVGLDNGDTYSVLISENSLELPFKKNKIISSKYRGDSSVTAIHYSGNGNLYSATKDGYIYRIENYPTNTSPTMIADDGNKTVMYTSGLKNIHSLIPGGVLEFYEFDLPPPRGSMESPTLILALSGTGNLYAWNDSDYKKIYLLQQGVYKVYPLATSFAYLIKNESEDYWQFKNANENNPSFKPFDYTTCIFKWGGINSSGELGKAKVICSFKETTEGLSGVVNVSNIDNGLLCVTANDEIYVIDNNGNWSKKANPGNSKVTIIKGCLGNLILVGTEGGEVYTFNPQTDVFIEQNTGTTNPIIKFLLTENEISALTSKGEKIVLLTGPAMDDVNNFKVAPNGMGVAFGDNSLYIYDTKNSGNYKTFTGDNIPPVSCLNDIVTVSFSPNKTMAVLAANTSIVNNKSLDGQIWIYFGSTWKQIGQNTTVTGANGKSKTIYGAIGNAGIISAVPSWSESGDSIVDISVKTSLAGTTNQLIYCASTQNWLKYNTDLPAWGTNQLYALNVCPNLKSSQLACILDINDNYNPQLWLCKAGKWSSQPIWKGAGSVWSTQSIKNVNAVWGKNGNLSGAIIKTYGGSYYLYDYINNNLTPELDSLPWKDSKWNNGNIVPSGITVSGSGDSTCIAVYLNSTNALATNPIWIYQNGAWLSEPILVNDKATSVPISNLQATWNNGVISSLLVTIETLKTDNKSYYLYEAASGNWINPSYYSFTNLKLNGISCSNQGTAVLWGQDQGQADNGDCDLRVYQGTPSKSWTTILTETEVKKLKGTTFNNALPLWNSNGDLGSLFLWAIDSSSGAKQFMTIAPGESSGFQAPLKITDPALAELTFSDVIAVPGQHAAGDKNSNASSGTVQGAVIKSENNIIFYTISGYAPFFSKKLPEQPSNTWSLSDNIVKVSVDPLNLKSGAVWIKSDSNINVWICENGVWRTTAETAPTSDSLNKTAILWNSDGSFNKFSDGADAAYHTPVQLTATGSISNTSYKWRINSPTVGHLILTYDIPADTELNPSSQLIFNLTGAFITAIYPVNGPDFQVLEQTEVSNASSDPVKRNVILVAGSSTKTKGGTSQLVLTLGLDGGSSPNVSISDLKFNIKAKWASKKINVKFDISGLPSSANGEIDLYVGSVKYNSVKNNNSETVTVQKYSPMFISPEIFEGHTYTCSPEFLDYYGYRNPPVEGNVVPPIVPYDNSSAPNPTVTITYSEVSSPVLTQKSTLPNWPDKIAMGTMWNAADSDSYYKNGQYDFITVYTRNGAAMQTVLPDQYEYIFPGQIRNLNDFCATITRNQYTLGANRPCRPLATIYTANLSGGDLNGALQTMGLYASSSADKVTISGESKTMLASHHNAQLLAQNLALAANVAYVLENKIGGNNPSSATKNAVKAIVEQAKAKQEQKRTEIKTKAAAAKKAGNLQLAQQLEFQVYTDFNADSFEGQGIITNPKYQVGSIVVNPDFLSWTYQNTTSGETVMNSNYYIDYVMRFLTNWLENGNSYTGPFQFSAQSAADLINLSGSPLTIQKQTATLCNSWEGMVQQTQDALNSSFINSWKSYISKHAPPTSVDSNNMAVYPSTTTPKPYPSSVTETFTDDFAGYVKAVNYLINRYGPNVTFGWDCGVYFKSDTAKKLYGKEWVHYRNPADASSGSSSPIQKAISDYYSKIKLVDKTNSNISSDFLVFDLASYSPLNSEKWLEEGWLMNGPSFNNWFNYIKAMTSQFEVPAMLWQMSGGRIPTKQDMSTWKWGGYYGTLPNYIFGTKYTNNTNSPFIPYNPNISSTNGITNLPSGLGSLILPLSGNYVKTKIVDNKIEALDSNNPISTVLDYLNDQGLSETGTVISGNWDWTKDNLKVLSDAGVFAIEFGGLSLPMAGICNKQPAPNNNWLYQALLGYWAASEIKAADGTVLKFDNAAKCLSPSPGVPSPLPVLKPILPKSGGASQTGKKITFTVTNGLESSSPISSYIKSVVGYVSPTNKTNVPYTYNAYTSDDVTMYVNITYSTNNNASNNTSTIYQTISMDIPGGDAYNFSRSSAQPSSIFYTDTIGIKCTVTPNNNSQGTPGTPVSATTTGSGQATIDAATMQSLKTNGGTINFSVVYVPLPNGASALKPQHTSSQTVNSWNINTNYNTDSEVIYNTTIFKANWENKGVKPEKRNKLNAYVRNAAWAYVSGPEPQSPPKPVTPVKTKKQPEVIIPKTAVEWSPSKPYSTANTLVKWKGKYYLNAWYAGKKDTPPASPWYQEPSKTIYTSWSSNAKYTAGDLVIYKNEKYKCISNAAGWQTPGNHKSNWSKVD